MARQRPFLRQPLRHNGTLEVDREVVDRALRVIADPDQLERFATDPDWPLLAITIIQANARGAYPAAP
jgi:hypothetical protein